MTVRCKDCAWLAVRIKLTRNLVGADEAYRASGYVASTNYGGRGIAEQIYDSLPVCFANERNFYETIQTPQPDQDRVLRAVNQDLECAGFEEWNPGISPSELRDMKMLEDQRKWQATESDKSRIFQEQEAAKAETRHTDSLKVARDVGRADVRSQLLVAMVGAIVALLAVWTGSLLNRPQPIVVQPASVVLPQATTPPDVGH